MLQTGSENAMNTLIAAVAPGRARPHGPRERRMQLLAPGYADYLS